MSALALLGGLSGGAGGQSFGNAGPSGVGDTTTNVGFGGFGGLTFNGGSSDTGVNPLVLYGLIGGGIFVAYMVLK